MGKETTKEDPDAKRANNPQPVGDNFTFADKPAHCRAPSVELTGCKYLGLHPSRPDDHRKECNCNNHCLTLSILSIRSFRRSSTKLRQNHERIGKISTEKIGL